MQACRKDTVLQQTGHATESCRAHCCASATGLPNMTVWPQGTERAVPREALHAALRSLIGVPCRPTLAANSLMLRFDFGRSEKGRAYVWIDPPWRMTLAGLFVGGSADCPVWDDGEDTAVNQALWEAWCALLDPLRSTTLAEASLHDDTPDLRLGFASGHQIETFGNYREGCWWYYRDRLTGEVFEAGREGITHEFGEPAE